MKRIHGRLESPGGYHILQRGFGVLEHISQL